MYDLVIIGGGNLGHTISGVMVSRGFRVLILTRDPGKWDEFIEVEDLNGKVYNGKIEVSNDFAQIKHTTHILFTLPGNVLLAALNEIEPYVKSDHIIGHVVSSTGFFWQARKVLGQSVSLYGFQRVPFISRIKEYGKRAVITGYKKVNKIAILGSIETKNFLSDFYADRIGGELVFLKSYLEAALTNSNPLLHTARMYSLFKDFESGTTTYHHIPYLYREWDIMSSELLINMDSEFQFIIAKLEVSNENFPSILDYYESFDARSLTHKIQGIPAFKDILTPMIQNESFYLPDLGNRIFEEDIPYGLVIIKSLGKITEIETPNIDKVLFWSQNLMKKCYYKEALLEGKDIESSACISNFNITNIEALLHFK